MTGPARDSTQTSRKMATGWDKTRRRPKFFYIMMSSMPQAKLRQNKGIADVCSAGAKPWMNGPAPFEPARK